MAVVMLRTMFLYGEGSNGILDEWGRSPQNPEIMFDEFEGGAAVGASYNIFGPQGGIQLEDMNGDGVYDQLRVTGAMEMVFPLMLVDANNDGKPDFFHIGSIAGMIDPCNGYDGSQPLYFPIGRSDDCGHMEDERGPVLDLNGDGSLDPEFACGPVLWRASMVPVLGNLALLVLALALVGVSLFALRAFA